MPGFMPGFSWSACMVTNKTNEKNAWLARKNGQEEPAEPLVKVSKPSEPPKDVIFLGS